MLVMPSAVQAEIEEIPILSLGALSVYCPCLVGDL